uniref:Interferon lambda receptor 1-like n=1 Tax=Gadus morhua TaxID=8049 RepID=A0A8C5BUM1_GADMO
MEYLLPVLFLMIQCSHTALDTLPAPINVSMDSRNFRHELTWAPGPGTPPETYYKFIFPARIDPPWLSLVGGDHRLELNISLPKAHKSAKIEDILNFYNAKTFSMDMTNSSMVLENLEAGMNYCVRVHLRIRINPHTWPSRCVYASTSDPEPRIAVPLLVLVVVGTVALLVGLHYTGYLCGIKAHVPAVLLVRNAINTVQPLLLNDRSL